jgi:hypothetical protein
VQRKPYMSKAKFESAWNAYERTVNKKLIPKGARTVRKKTARIVVSSSIPASAPPPALKRTLRELHEAKKRSPPTLKRTLKELHEAKMRDARIQVVPKRSFLQRIGLHDGARVKQFVSEAVHEPKENYLTYRVGKRLIARVKQERVDPEKVRRLKGIAVSVGTMALRAGRGFLEDSSPRRSPRKTSVQGVSGAGPKPFVCENCGAKYARWTKYCRRCDEEFTIRRTRSFLKQVGNTRHLQ